MRPINQKIIISLIGFIIILTGLSGQTQAVLNGISVDAKRNGAFITINSTQNIKSENVTGWSASSDWFYITVLDAVTDSIKLVETELTSPLTDLEVHNYAESAQIAFKINQEVESFDIYTSEAPPGILISLRFPIDKIYSALEEEKDEMLNGSTAPVSLSKLQKQNMYKRLRAALYVAGTGLAIGGILTEDNSTNANNWELPAGLGIIATTYLYDTFVKQDEPDY
jgi:hypothetical protein